MIYVYGVMDALVVPDVAGLEGAPVEARELDGLVLAVSRLDDGAPTPSDEAVLRHAEVVEALMQAGASVVPARFGLVFDTEAAFEQVVRDHREELGAALEQVRGCVELGLRVLAPEQEHTPGAFADGAEYLRARLRESEARERLARELHEALAPRARGAQLSPTSGPWLLSAAYLVPAGSVEDFRRHVETLESSHPEVELVCTGPWPPYSFAPTSTDAP